jgi:hypothetical protein
VTADRLGISGVMFYSYRSKYSGMRVKELKEDDARLKRIYADLSLFNDPLKQVLEPVCRQAGKSTGGYILKGVAVSMVID